ncbi:hypothetical protein BGW41_007285, partial [Actinomortierella wolfii]
MAERFANGVQLLIFVSSQAVSVGTKRKAEGTGDDDLSHLFDDDLKASNLQPEPSFNPWTANKSVQLVNVA